MQTNQTSSVSNGDKDPELWMLAQKRASFKRHLSVYVIMNIFFWVVWLFTRHNHPDNYNFYDMNFPWPIWSMFGWGIGLFFHFMAAYVYSKSNSAEREYEKLKNKNL